MDLLEDFGGFIGCLIFWPISMVHAYPFLSQLFAQKLSSDTISLTILGHPNSHL